MFYFPTDASQTLTDFHEKLFISPRTPHRPSRTSSDQFRYPHVHIMNIHGLLRTNFRFPNGHLTDAHGILWTNFDFPTDNSWTLTDFHGRILVSALTPYGRSRTFMDEFFISPRTPHGRSRTFTDNIRFFHGHPWDVH